VPPRLYLKAMDQKPLKALVEFLSLVGIEEIYAPGGEKNEPAPGGEKEPALCPQKEKLLNELYEKNKDCCRCEELCKNRTRIVFYDGNPCSKVMFVGEAPGEQEDLLGKPFVGKAGQYLNRVLEKIGWSRNSIYITNVCKCRPPGNRKPTPQEMQTCFGVFLKHEIEIVDPKVICCLGATAAEALLGKHVRITKMRGQFFTSPLLKKPIKIFLTFHPAFVLRQRQYAKLFEEDLKKLKEFVEKELAS